MIMGTALHRQLLAQLPEPPANEEIAADNHAGDDGEPENQAEQAARLQVHVVNPAPALPALFLLVDLVVERLELLRFLVGLLLGDPGIDELDELWVGAEGTKRAAAGATHRRLGVERLVLHHAV